MRTSCRVSVIVRAKGSGVRMEQRPFDSSVSFHITGISVQDILQPIGGKPHPSHILYTSALSPNWSRSQTTAPQERMVTVTRSSLDAVKRFEAYEVDAHEGSTFVRVALLLVNPLSPDFRYCHVSCVCVCCVVCCVCCVCVCVLCVCCVCVCVVCVCVCVRRASDGWSALPKAQSHPKQPTPHRK
jgi:hypothetical protein